MTFAPVLVVALVVSLMQLLVLPVTPFQLGMVLASSYGSMSQGKFHLYFPLSLNIGNLVLKLDYQMQVLQKQLVVHPRTICLPLARV